jgi:hypothetical protein
MKIIQTLLFVVIAISCFSQKKGNSSVMPMGDGIYIVSKQGSTGFTSLGKLRTRAYDAANEYAKEHNSIAEIVSVNETPQGFGVFPNVDVKFRLVANSKILADSTATTVSLSSAHSANGKVTDAQVTIKNPKEDSNKKLEKLEKLGKLYKDGFLTKEEFEAEKKKILNEN